jgi:hypothetical protein
MPEIKDLGSPFEHISGYLIHEVAQEIYVEFL